MTAKKTKKILLIILAGLLIVQIPWFIAIQIYINKTQVKTTATVIRIGAKEAGCTGDGIIKRDPTCDHSDRLYPIYEYFDQAGQRYEQEDIFGEYKRNNPLRLIFGKDVGDKVTAYYSKDKPQEAMFIAGHMAYVPWLFPLYMVIPIAVSFGVIAVIIKSRKR